MDYVIKYLRQLPPPCQAHTLAGHDNAHCCRAYVLVEYVWLHFSHS